MQPDLPWNVAGIPPEAREAARAAARREGLSVGEWLTRRILRSLMDGADPNGWPRNGNGTAQTNGSDERAPVDRTPSGRDSDEVMERVSRAESDSIAVNRKIEDQVRALGRRLEAAERAQSEHGRAVSKAASEINIATREQTQAFDQLGTHVVELGDRLARIERAAGNDGVRDAVKGLHSGLARLADQITETSHHSAGQIAALAGNVENLATRLGDVKSESADAARALDARLATFEDRVRAIEAAVVTAQTTASQPHPATEARIADVEDRLRSAETIAQAAATRTDPVLEARVTEFENRIRSAETTAQAAVTRTDPVLEARVTEFENRIRSAETTAQAAANRTDPVLEARIAAFEDHAHLIETATESNSTRLDAALAAIEALRTADVLEPHRETLVQLNETLERLATRITAGEAQNAGVLARLEDQIAKLETQQNEALADRRLQGIEHVLSDIAGRMETAERNTATAGRIVEETLRNFSSRLDANERRQEEALAEARAARVEATPPPPPVQAPGANFDLPPFHDTQTFHDTQAPSFHQAHAAGGMDDLPPFGGGSGFGSDHGFGAESFASISAQAGAGSAADTYLSAARRSARESAADPRIGATTGAFAWTAPPAASLPVEEPPLKDAGGSTRFLLVAAIVVMASAVVAGILLSRGVFGHVQPAPEATATHATVSEAVTQPAAVPDVASATPPAQTSVDAGTPAAASTLPSLPPRLLTVHPRVAALQVRPTPVAPAQTLATVPQAAPLPSRPAGDHVAALATAGSAKAELLMGLRYLDGGDGAAVNEAEAAKWLERAASQGEAIAAYRLGTLYERGHGVPADAAKAIQWYSAAAKLGNRKAMHNLAVAYAEGTGTQKDLQSAAQWFSRAAAMGLADSQFNLAVLYERGMGVQQSLVDAYKWYAIAAAQGDAGSKARIDAIATQLNPDERAAAQKAAAEFHPLPLDRNANVPPDPTVVD